MSYLEQLRVLDSKTLLVHAVHLTDADWEIVGQESLFRLFLPAQQSEPERRATRHRKGFAVMVW